MENKNKVFGIGLSKTGTKSLVKAFKILGYKAVHYPRNLNVIKNYDAGADISVATAFKELDKKYPKAKFILTVRDEKPWVQSMHNHGILYPPHTKSKASLEWRKKVWGAIQLNDDLRNKVYLKHVREVKKYFKNQKDKLLIMNICDGDGWEKLCPFLNKPIPKIRFPRINVTKNKYKYKKLIDKNN